MAVLERSSLGDSPLADLHALASELGIDGYRKLRREELIDALLAKKTDKGSSSASEGRQRSRSSSSSSERGNRQPRTRTRSDRPERTQEQSGDRDRTRRSDEKLVSAEGVVELRRGGSAFLRLSSDGPTDADPFISAAQVRRCELKDNDRVSGPVRPPRRSERYPSLARIETINGKSADTVKPPADVVAARAERKPRSEQTAAKVAVEAKPIFPSELFELAAGDSRLADVQQLVPFGRGSRVTVTGAVGAGKSELLRRVAQVLAKDKQLALHVVLAGVRPEELPLWEQSQLKLDAKLTFESKISERERAVSSAVEAAKRIFNKGGAAVVIVDSVAGLSSTVKSELMAAARKLSTGASLTVVVANDSAIGGETTFITMNPGAVRGGSFPAIDMAFSNTVNPELLVGERGVKRIAKAINKASRRIR